MIKVVITGEARVFNSNEEKYTEPILSEDAISAALERKKLYNKVAFTPDDYGIIIDIGGVGAVQVKRADLESVVKYIINS